MIFNDVQLLNSGKHSDAKLEENVFLMKYWENIRDLFLIYLPDNFDFLGMKKLKVKLGPFEGDAFIPAGEDGIATFKIQNFTYEFFYELSEEEKNEKSLSYIEEALTKICDQFKLPSDIKETVKKTAQLVRENSFEHFRTHSKTSKWHKSRKLRAVTELHFKKGGINATLIITNKSGDIIIKQNIFESKFWESAWFDLWKGYWIDNKFKIENRTGKVYFETRSFDEIAI